MVFCSAEKQRPLVNLLFFPGNTSPMASGEPLIHHLVQGGAAAASSPAPLSPSQPGTRPKPAPTAVRTRRGSVPGPPSEGLEVAEGGGRLKHFGPTRPQS